MGKTWLFYDVESTDLNPAFGQIMQYASIRVDESWQEVDRTMFYVSLTHDRLLSPEAMLVHRIPVLGVGESLCEHEAAQRIFDDVNATDTVNGGYNTLGFDDEVLRFTFFRNFLEPYTHGFKNGCQRFDLYPLMLLYYYFQSECVKWPTISDRPTFKLEKFNECNDLVQGMAHDALVDVGVCVELAKRLSHDEALWVQGLSALTQRHFNKSVSLLLDARLGAECRYAAWVIKLAEHHVYKNTSFWIRLDKVKFQNLEDVKSALFRKKSADTRLIIQDESLQPDNQLVDDNLMWLESHGATLSAWLNELTSKLYSRVMHLDVDASLYALGTLSPNEMAYASKFKQDPQQSLKHIDDQPPRLKQMIMRYLWRHYPGSENLKSSDMLFHQHQLYRPVVNDFRGRARQTPNDVLQRTRVLLGEKTNQEDINLLTDLERYLVNNFLGEAL